MCIALLERLVENIQTIIKIVIRGQAFNHFSPDCQSAF
jgi:hypothetical protein